MIYYCDTSLLVAALAPETATERAQTWLAAQQTGALAISEWVITEFSSALAIKLRTGQIDLDHRAQIFGLFNRLLAESLVTVEIAPTAFRMASGFVDQYGLGLRAGDALHLAVAAQHGLTLVTLDLRLLEAGPILGVQTHGL